MANGWGGWQQKISMNHLCETMLNIEKFKNNNPNHFEIKYVGNGIFETNIIYLRKMLFYYSFICASKEIYFITVTKYQGDKA